MDIRSIIVRKLVELNGEAKIKLLRGEKYFEIRLLECGVEVSNLNKESFLEWKVFDKTIELLSKKGVWLKREMLCIQS